MDYRDITRKAIEEIELQTFGSTRQFLEVHELEYSNTQPQVARVDNEEVGTAIVYFPVKNEKFHLCVYLDTKPRISVRAVSTEPYVHLYLTASSETLNLEQIVALTSLKPTSAKEKIIFGRKRCVIHFDPNPEPDAFEDKLSKVLHYLEQDKKGIISLAEKTNASIQVVLALHNGNTMLGGFSVDKESIARMDALHLRVDFDLYADGNFFKEDPPSRI